MGAAKTTGTTTFCQITAIYQHPFLTRNITEAENKGI
jgi:hypothetical protein